jgi:hypothetical protein
VHDRLYENARQKQVRCEHTEYAIQRET